jgi:hypothetical protein
MWRSEEQTALYIKNATSRGAGMNIKKAWLLIGFAMIALSVFTPLECKAEIVYAGAISGDLYQYLGGGTIGTEFYANGASWVTQLGLYDYDSSDGFHTDHAIGLYDSGGNLLGSVQLSAGTGAMLDGNGYRWASLATPVQLQTGMNYIIAAYYPDGQDYFYVTATIDPLFTFVSDLCKDGGSELVVPNTTQFNDGQRGWFGPNFNAQVPEPQLILLLGVGFGAVIIASRRMNN